MQKLKLTQQTISNLSVLVDMCQFNRTEVKSINLSFVFTPSMIGISFSSVKKVETVIDHLVKIMKNLRLNLLRELREDEVLRMIQREIQLRSYSAESYVPSAVVVLTDSASVSI